MPSHTHLIEKDVFTLDTGTILNLPLIYSDEKHAKYRPAVISAIEPKNETNKYSDDINDYNIAYMPITSKFANKSNEIQDMELQIVDIQTAGLDPKKESFIEIGNQKKIDAGKLPKVLEAYGELGFENNNLYPKTNINPKYNHQNSSDITRMMVKDKEITENYDNYKRYEPKMAQRYRDLYSRFDTTKKAFNTDTNRLNYDANTSYTRPHIGEYNIKEKYNDGPDF